MAEVVLKNVKKIYQREDRNKEEVVAVHSFNLEIKDKEFIVLVGPSGCGKSTTLRMIAGLEKITEGEIYIDGELVNLMEPKDRDIAMVFQNYALYPHMTVYDNMAFPLKRGHRNLSKEEIDARVREAAAILDISELLKRKPKALSGGQRQRVAIGRAIVRHPKAFLMDEPLSNLDAKLRNQMRAEIIKLREKVDTTFIYVTHDQIEAMTLGDRIVIMKDGYIQQIGTPQQVFSRPANKFVAGFIGTPQMNFFDGKIVERDGAFGALVKGAFFPLTQEQQAGIGREMDVTVGVRPVHIFLSDDGIPAKVDVSEMMGSELHLHLDSEGQDVVAVVPTADLDEAIIDGRIKTLNYSFQPKLMHFFDKETGQNLLYG